MTLEELLKRKGWGDQDLEAVRPLLSDQRFRQTLEEEYGAIASELASAKQRDAEWQRKLDEDYNPRIFAAEQEAQKARRELADAREQIQIAKDYGYLTEDQAKTAIASAEAKAATTSNGYDPSKHPTWDDVNKFADAEGQAIAMAADLTAEYAQLHGGRSIYEYESVINGQSMRGMQALRQEAKSARQPLDKYVSDKFDFAGKRRAMAEQKERDREASIRKDERERAEAEFATRLGANPNILMARPSTAPFIPPRTNDGKQPWERGTAQQRKAESIARLTALQAKGGVQ